ncbi:phosphatase PAP2 family protein [Ferdinandcohnia quinoae]|uniref:Phosphatase PAP2 family protein n=1 Tax=Fredinandcohnia quinoae TaxID=2918902 RepID=A0AAW5E346_9BACI|nr:phosphatase PAP2 family protein [Fredinandcohnia sp. SECRCQ15]MCH1627331.1 phosphatase PAP2 family protein [Fredinandcohnia sp. SECRCQ15]
MKKYIKKAPYLLFLLVIPLLAIIYTLLNNRANNAVDISTTFDQAIPFLPIFIIPYIIWYAYIFCYLIYFCFKDTTVFIKSLILITMGELVCFVIYYFFQTTVPRPTLSGDGFLTMLVQWIYSNDQPYNCFPSIHVLTTFVIMLASINIKNKHILNTISIHVIGSLIILSTLFVKQHVIFDMIGSMLLVTFLYGIAFELITFRVSRKMKTVYVEEK